MRLPSHSTVAAYAALFVALGGSAYAATQIGSKQIRNNSIRSADIKDRAIATRDLSLKARNALKGQTGAQGATGAQGSPGAQGPAGLSGPQGPSGVPENAVVVSPDGTAIENGAQLRDALAALPAATADAPQAIVLGVGHYDAGSPSAGFTIPAFVTLAGQGPHTVVENRTANFQPVLGLSDGSVVRDISVVNTSTSVGARGIDGQTSTGTLVEGVRVEARAGILLRSSTLRDASVTAVSEGLRMTEGASSSTGFEVDNVSVIVTNPSGSAVGVLVDGAARLDGVDTRVQASSAATGLRFTATDGTLSVRDSTFDVLGPTTAVGVDVDPTAASTARMYFDHSRADAVGATGYGYRTSGSTSRIGSSTLGGSTADISEGAAAQARCVDTHDSGYVGEVSC